MVRKVLLWLARALPLAQRWIEIAPTCCGTCASCYASMGTGLTTTVIGTFRRRT
jgi:hypothetical protein